MPFFNLQSLSKNKTGSSLLDQTTPKKGVSLADIERWEHDLFSEAPNLVTSPAKVKFRLVLNTRLL